MKQPNALLKLGALASSALLVAGFVAYRAGAFDWMTRDSSPPPASTPEQPIMSGSKFSVILIPEAGPQAIPTTEVPPTLLGGSKSLSIGPLIPPPTPKAVETPQQQKP